MKHCIEQGYCTCVTGNCIAIQFKELQQQIDEKEKLLIAAFVDAKTGVVQMTRKYDEWIIYLQAAIKGGEK